MKGAASTADPRLRAAAVIAALPTLIGLAPGMLAPLLGVRSAAFGALTGLEMLSPLASPVFALAAAVGWGRGAPSTIAPDDLADLARSAAWLAGALPFAGLLGSCFFGWLAMRLVGEPNPAQQLALAEAWPAWGRCLLYGPSISTAFSALGAAFAMQAGVRRLAALCAVLFVLGTVASLGVVWLACTVAI